MNFIDFVFFFYMFLALYMLLLLLLIYFPNRKNIFDYPPAKIEPISIVMPCYNESKNIGEAIDSLLNMDYPKDKIEIIIVDDKSTDNSVEIIRKYIAKYKNIRLIVNKRNSGGAAEPTNLGIKAAKYDYIAVVDSDSTPGRDALKKMLGFLQKEEDVGGVTCSILSKKPRNFIQRMQAIEYVNISLTRKLLDLVDSVYVTPGPLALYKKKILMEVGLFDKNNLTQDIEIVWKMLSYGYKARMCLPARVYSSTPSTFRGWWKQRVRWNIGGTQTLMKYKNLVFRKGMLGLFVIPFFSVSLFLGIFGLFLFSYLFIRRALISYLLVNYTNSANVALFRLSELSFAPSVLNFFGFSLFFVGILFLCLVIFDMKEEHVKLTGAFNILIYNIFYLLLQPINLIHSVYKFARGKYSW